jgi:DNA-binding NarL/FixJ family response regulator
MSNQLIVEALRRDSKVDPLPLVCTPQNFSSQLLSLSPDIVLLGERSASPRQLLECIRVATTTLPGARSIVLLDSAKSELVIEAFRTGARGVICREESIDVLLDAIHSVHKGHIWMGDNQFQYLMGTLEPTSLSSVVDDNGTALLTKRELDVVQGVIDGLTNKEIASRLQLSEHTVKNYLFRLFDKLGVSNRAELVSYAHAHRSFADGESRSAN